MGLGQWGAKVFKSIKETVSETVEGTINIVKKTADFAQEVYDDPLGKTNKVWNGVTGRDKFDEAEELLKKIEDKYDKAKFNYEKEIEEININLKNKLEKINYHKKDVFNNHFKKFTLLGNKLHNLNIEGKSFLEYFDDSITEIKNQSGVKDKSKLYEIDFNNLSLKELGLGILTLGFFTRKKAKETLAKVENEEKRINEEIVKMDSQIKKLNVIVESINNVSHYFEVLIKNYSNLLDRFEYGISTQIQKTLLVGKRLENGKLDFKLMPIKHIEDFQALFNLSIVLKQMATMGYLNDEVEIVVEDIEAIKNIESKISELNILAA